MQRIATDDGVELHVALDGDPELPALVLVNGAFCAIPVWNNAIDALAQSFLVVRHDVRGTGASEPGTDDAYTFERYSADIIEVCRHLSIDRAHVWGMAWGARVALVFAALYPDRVDRLVLSDFAIDPADPEAQKAGMRAAAEARTEAGLEEAPKPAGWNDHRDPGEAGKAIAATHAHPDLMPFVIRVRSPTLVLTGEHDPNLVSSRRALGGFTDARLVEVPLSGHGLIRQRPDEVIANVIPFLGGI